MSRPAASRSARSASCAARASRSSFRCPSSAVLALARSANASLSCALRRSIHRRRRAAFSAPSAVEQGRELDAGPDVRRDGAVLGQPPQAPLTTLELGQAALELDDVGVELLRLGEGVEVLLRRRGRPPGAGPGPWRRRPRWDPPRPGRPRRQPRRRSRRDPCRGGGQPLRARRTGDGGAGRWAEASQGAPRPCASTGTLLRRRSAGGRRSVDVRSCGAATGGQDMALRWLAIGILGFMIGAAVMVFTDGGDDSASAETAGQRRHGAGRRSGDGWRERGRPRPHR